MADVQQLQQDIQALQAQLQQLQQLQQQQQPAPAPPQFALLPALANIGILDYNTSEGSNIYKQAVKPLKDEFDGTPGGLNVLLAQLRDRAIAYGWTRILTIPPNLNAPNTTIDIIDGYGQLTLAQVCTHAESYVNDQSHLTQATSKSAAERVLHTLQPKLPFALMHDAKQVMESILEEEEMMEKRQQLKQTKHTYHNNAY